MKKWPGGWFMRKFDSAEKTGLSIACVDDLVQRCSAGSTDCPPWILRVGSSATETGLHELNVTLPLTPLLEVGGNFS